MERERAYEAESQPADAVSAEAETFEPLSFTYRHGTRSAEIVVAELSDTSGKRVEIIETGTSLNMRIAARFNTALDDPVIGFLIRNRHGISAFGTNTGEQRLDLGSVRRGETIEVTFSFDCWLGIDNYSISCAVHSREGEGYDWLDGVRFFRVTSLRLTEGIANLNATASARRLHTAAAGPQASELVSAGQV